MRGIEQSYTCIVNACHILQSVHSDSYSQGPDLPVDGSSGNQVAVLMIVSPV